MNSPDTISLDQACKIARQISDEIRALAWRDGLDGDRYKARLVEVTPMVDAVMACLDHPHNNGIMSTYDVRKRLVLSGSPELLHRHRHYDAKSLGPEDWTVLFKECRIGYVRELLSIGFNFSNFLLPLLLLRKRQPGLDDMMVEAIGSSNTALYTLTELVPHENFLSQDLHARMWRKAIETHSGDISDLVFTKLTFGDPVKLLITAWYAGMIIPQNFNRFATGRHSGLFIDAVSSEHGKLKILGICPDLESHLESPSKVRDFVVKTA
jgi:hypothetical protein